MVRHTSDVIPEGIAMQVIGDRTDGPLLCCQVVHSPGSVRPRQWRMVRSHFSPLQRILRQDYGSGIDVLLAARFGMESFECARSV